MNQEIIDTITYVLAAVVGWFAKWLKSKLDKPKEPK